jgi:hypothetical protein
VSSKAAHPLIEWLWALAVFGAGSFAAWNGHDHAKLFGPALLEWPLLALGGRALLALLPPGSPPEPGTLRWLHTSAASLALGALLEPFPLWLAPGLALLVWAWPRVFGPRAMVPRHAPFQAPFGPLDWALAGLLPLALLLAGLERCIVHPGQLLGLWTAAGLLDLCLCHAGCSPRQRALGLGLLAPVALIGTPPGALTFVPLLSVGWLRRADRRCLALAGALVVLAGGPTWPVGLWLALWVALSTGPSRIAAAAVFGASLGLAALAEWAEVGLRFGQDAALASQESLLLLWPAFGLFAALLGLPGMTGRSAARTQTERPESRWREPALMLGAALACGLSGVTWRYGLVLLLPGALLIASARRPAPRGGGA